MNIAWLTDIHLNFIEKKYRLKFYKTIVSKPIDLVLISGDIAEAPTTGLLLMEMANTIKKPIYFVLGNHDYYGGQVSDVRNEMIQLTNIEPLLHWLPALDPIALGKDYFLVGQDGWADGRYGDFFHSPIMMNDSRFIYDLYVQKQQGSQLLLAKMQQLADIDAQLLQDKIEAAIAQGARKLLILTHTPPFKESCFYRGKATDDNFLPFYASKATGQVMLECAKHYKQDYFLMLCGHTHTKNSYQPLDNLLVKTGHAEYYKPMVQEYFTI